MAQVDVTTAESLTKAQNSDESWGMCGKHCKTWDWQIVEGPDCQNAKLWQCPGHYDTNFYLGGADGQALAQAKMMHAVQQELQP